MSRSDYRLHCMKRRCIPAMLAVRRPAIPLRPPTGNGLLSNPMLPRPRQLPSGEASAQAWPHRQPRLPPLGFGYTAARRGRLEQGFGPTAPLIKPEHQVHLADHAQLGPVRLRRRCDLLMTAHVHDGRVRVNAGKPEPVRPARNEHALREHGLPPQLGSAELKRVGPKAHSPQLGRKVRERAPLPVAELQLRAGRDPRRNPGAHFALPARVGFSPVLHGARPGTGGADVKSTEIPWRPRPRRPQPLERAPAQYGAWELGYSHRLFRRPLRAPD